MPAFPSTGNLLPIWRWPSLAAAAIFVCASFSPPCLAQSLDPSRVEMLIKSTLVALNQANLTGNYTVLRDIGSPAFRDHNTDAALAITFTSFRDKRIDLEPVVVLDPTLKGTKDKQGRLKLEGSFPTRPLAVQFSMLFEPVNGQWLLADLAVGVVAVKSPPAAEPKAPPPPPAYLDVPDWQPAFGGTE